MKYKIMGIALVFLGVINSCSGKSEGELLLEQKDQELRNLLIENSNLHNENSDLRDENEELSTLLNRLVASAPGTYKEEIDKFNSKTIYVKAEIELAKAKMELSKAELELSKALKDLEKQKKLAKRDKRKISENTESNE